MNIKEITVIAAVPIPMAAWNAAQEGRAEVEQFARQESRHDDGVRSRRRERRART